MGRARTGTRAPVAGTRQAPPRAASDGRASGSVDPATAADGRPTGSVDRPTTSAGRSTAPSGPPTAAARESPPAGRGPQASAPHPSASPSGMALREPLDYIRDATAQALDIPDDTLERLLSVLEPASRVFTYGRGRSGFVARAFAVRLMHLGYQTYVVGETITAPVQKDDVVVCFSGSGTTYPVVMTAELGRRAGARVVAVTADPDSEVARLAHVVISLRPPDHNGRRERYAPLGTLYETAAWIFCDGVVALLKERLGETEERMRERHATLE